jgi:hypothetical protein
MMWLVKSSDLKKIIAVKGGNDYDYHRTEAEKQAGAQARKGPKVVEC